MTYKHSQESCTRSCRIPLMITLQLLRSARCKSVRTARLDRRSSLQLRKLQLESDCVSLPLPLLQPLRVGSNQKVTCLSQTSSRSFAKPLLFSLLSHPCALNNVPPPFAVLSTSLKDSILPRTPPFALAALAFTEVRRRACFALFFFPSVLRRREASGS